VSACHPERSEGPLIWWKITQDKRDAVRRCEVPRRLRGSDDRQQVVTV
jgi:hypothetical protein